jgi:hypothetical protein
MSKEKKNMDVFQKSLKKVMEQSNESQEDGAGAVLCIQLLEDGINIGAAGDPHKISAVVAAAMETEPHIRAIIQTSVTLIEAKESGKLDEVLKNVKPTTEA